MSALPAMTPPPGRRRRPAMRLYGKLMLALFLSLLGSVTSTEIYFRVFRHRHPWPAGRPHPGDPPRLPHVLGLLPLEPLVFGGVALVVTGSLLAWYLARPLKHLSWGLREVSAGRLQTRVSPLMGGRQDEIADLAHDFDGMAARLQQLTESRRLLLHDVSHELRSPLSRMQAAIGLARQAPASPENTEAMLGRIEREANRLDELIGELLTLNRLEAGAPGAERARVDLVELLGAIVEDADFEARGLGAAVSLAAPAGFVSAVNGELVYRAFENVIRNAVKYTAPGTTVAVAAAVEDGGAALRVSVRDHGPGVPADLLETIFDPFVRVAGSEHVRGVGLGLAIARRAVLLHHGRIAAQPAGAGAGEGLRVEIWLPRSEL